MTITPTPRPAKRTFARKLAAGGTAAALTLGLVSIAPAIAQDGPSTEQGSADDQGRFGHRMARRAHNHQELADLLGISVGDLTSAMQQVRQTIDEQFGDIPRDERDRDAMRDAAQDALADELGVSVADLDAARDTMFRDHLAQRVADGQITQEEADEILAAYENGTLDEFRRARHAERFEQRLADAVADGQITQDQADEIQSHYDDGTLREWMEARREAGEEPLLPRPDGERGPGRFGPGRDHGPDDRPGPRGSSDGPVDELPPPPDAA